MLDLINTIKNLRKKIKEIIKKSQEFEIFQGEGTHE